MKDEEEGTPRGRRATAGAARTPPSPYSSQRRERASRGAARAHTPDDIDMGAALLQTSFLHDAGNAE